MNEWEYYIQTANMNVGWEKVNTASILKNFWFNVNAGTGPVNTAGGAAHGNKGDHLIAKFTGYHWHQLYTYSKQHSGMPKIWI